jgi:hypothetical protein
MYYNIEKISTATLKNMHCNIEKICCNNEKYLLQQRKTCTATLKNMYCNIEKTYIATLKNYAATFEKM